MNIYKELKTNPTRRDLLEFGAIFAVAMALFGVYEQFRVGNAELAMRVWIIGAVVFVLAQLPVLGRLLYILWMGFGLTLGFFTVPVIMFVLYAVTVVPLGLWFRLRRRDTMRRTIDRGASSYWEDYPGTDDPTSYVRQF